MLEVSDTFYFVPFDKYIKIISYNSSQECDDMKNDEMYYTLINGRLYKNTLILEIRDRMERKDMEYSFQLPNYKLMETLYELPSDVTKRLVKWYIGYDAKSLEEVRIHLMAKVLGQYDN